MPWWIWLLLALFMLAMIIIGVVYAGIHGYRAFKGSVKVVSRAAQRFEEMGQPLQEPAQDETPFFIRPLQESADRYAQAHAEVIKRHEAKRACHAQQWARWKHFND